MRLREKSNWARRYFLWLLTSARGMPLHRPYGTAGTFCRFAFPTLKRGANKHCAYGADFRTFLAQFSIAALGLWFLTGCNVGPKYNPPTAPAVTGYTPQPQPAATATSAGPAGMAQHLDSAAALPAQWWTLFHSPELNGMMAQALANSPTLAQATAHLKEAQEELNARTGATKYPTVTGNASVEEEQLNLAAYGIPFPNPSPFTLLNGSVAVSYALDIFGANRRVIEGLAANRDYENWQLEGARLMLTGNVVSAAIRQAEVRKQIELTEQLLTVEQRELEITVERNRDGGNSDADVESRKTTVAQTQAAIPPLEAQLDTVNHQLAVLMGKSPVEAQIPGLSLEALQLPQELPLSLPSALVRQRPDIRAAESLLHQASANVGVATANLYPQIVLSGSGGGIGTSFVTGGDVWNVASSLTQPIYNGGALRAEKRKAEAAYQEANSVYRQTVLEAFGQVADTLTSIDHDAQTLKARSDATADADASYGIAQGRYQAGGISELVLLEAERQQLQTELDRTAATAARFSDSATLFQALGGGWWNAESASSF
ncbi:MAG: efflux transporter outer membrane subunit [Terracidiphilus sp.]|jgi:NodT family efflux transporter outer membrane factor (OMF) lipoprotein